jgi:hypothetical protein
MGFAGVFWYDDRPLRESGTRKITMALPAATQNAIPGWLRWVALLWLVVWFPAYWHAWGAKNFLQMCDIAVILTCVALWTKSDLLISSQAISSLFVCIAWALDAGWKLILGHHLIGGTEYLFDESKPLWIRLLSLYHLVLPALLLWLLYRMGYDRRGWALQSAIAVPVFIASRYASPQKNMNFALADPFFRRQWGPAPVHLLVIWLFMVFVVYMPTHSLLRKLFAQPKGREIHAGN